MSDYEIPDKPFTYSDLVEAYTRLIINAAMMRAALKEVMMWIENWEPEFVDDDEWPKTKKLVDTALKYE